MEISAKLKKASEGSVAIIASARQTNEELWLLGKLKARLGAISDAVPRYGRRRQTARQRGQEPEFKRRAVHGICFTEMGTDLARIEAGIESGKIKTLIVFGEDVTKHGIGADVLGKLETLIVSDILPNATTKLAHYILPGCAHAENAARSPARRAASRIHEGRRGSR